MWRAAPKPYVHPLRTPAGHCLTRLEPPDHRWHRGLWFTFKYVNGENFWEEEAPFGTQVHVDPNRIEWRRPNGDVVLREHRVLSHERLGDDAYALDWSSVITAAADAELDRTPFQGWGGYGGLTLRGRSDWRDTRLLLAGGASRTSGCWARRRAGATSPVCSTAARALAAWRSLDAPSNPRHPVPVVRQHALGRVRRRRLVELPERGAAVRRPARARGGARSCGSTTASSCTTASGPRRASTRPTTSGVRERLVEP